MAIFGNFKGTTKSEFKIGKNGAKIYGGPSRPTGNTVAVGDIWIDSSNTTLQVYDTNNTWVSIGVTLQSLDINDGQLVVDTDAGVIRADSDVEVNGDVTANRFVGDLVGNILTLEQIQISSDDVVEGRENKFFTDQRAQDALPSVDDVIYVNKNGRDVYDGKTEYRAFYTVSAAVESLGDPYKENFSEESYVFQGEKTQAATLLLANKEFIQAEVLEYIDAEETFRYDRVKCERDAGLIIDAVAFDLALGTNYNSVTAGLAYRRGNASNVLGDQLDETVAAINYLRDQIIALGLDAVSQSTVTDLFQDITDIINDNNVDTIVYADPSTATQDQIDAKDQLRANRTLIQNDVVTFVDTNYPTLTYDANICFRDVGYIVDALSHDILYDGNYASRIVADSYFTGVASELGSQDETNATIAAYTELQNIVGNVVLGTYAGQDTASGNATTSEANTLTSLLQITVDTLEAGNLSVLPSKIEPDVTGADTATLADYQSIQQQKANLQIATVEYVDNTFPRLMTEYQKAICRRDTGFIVDGLYEDLIRGGNQFSTSSGLAYYNGVVSRLPSDQLAPTVNAISYINTLASNVMLNIGMSTVYQGEVTQVSNTSLVAEPDSVDNVEKLVQGITDTIQSPRLSRAARIKSNISLAGELNPGGFANANILLEKNREFIQAEAMTYVDLNHANVMTQDQRQLCERDTGLIVDAVSTDLLVGGAKKSGLAAIAYYDANSQRVIPDDQVSPTTDTINYIRNIASNVIAQSNVSVLQTAVDQEFDANITTDPQANTYVDLLFSGISNTIEKPKIASPFSVVADFGPLAGNNPGGFDDAAQLLLKNREFIKNEVVAFVDATEKFVYDQAKCERDVGFIVDAVVNDLALGTNYNSVIAGIAYRRQASGYVLSNQFSQTIRAMEYIRDYILNDIGVQDDTRDAVILRFNDLLDVIRYDRRDNYFFTIPDISTATQVNAHYQLVRNRNLIQDEIIDFLEVEYTGLRYDEIRCRRDVGFVVDALSHDVLYGGNRASRIVADSYFAGTQNLLGGVPEIAATIDAYTELQNITGNVVQGVYSGQDTLAGNASVTEVTTLNGLLDITIDAIRAGNTSVIPALVAPDRTWIDEPLQSDSANILAQRSVIQTATVNFVDTELSNLVYDRDICKRDTGLIVDALAEDLLRGGYAESKQAALEYYRGTTRVIPQNELQATTNAISYIATLGSDIVQNNTIANVYQSNVTQVVDTGFQGEADAPDNLVFLVSGINSTITSAKPRRVAVKVAAGDYTIDNPVKLPPNTAIYGDGLRSTSIRPKFPTRDMFYMDNGTYLTGMTFRDHLAPAAAVAFDPSQRELLRPDIVTSPYIQNCTSRTSTGTGLRIDGLAVRGLLRSMVCDSYTQFNEGGVGVHILNRGYAQLVSVFTICCEDGFLCESGGTTSITNSNSSFGNNALRATGTSPMLYSGKLAANVETGKAIQVTNLPQQPNVSDAVFIDNANAYYTVGTVEKVDDFTSNVTLIENIVGIEFKQGDNVRFYQRSLIVASSHTFEFVGSGNQIASALPSLGGIPDPTGEGVFDQNNAGKVFYTSTNETGDFSVSGEFVINQNTGTVTGRTFDKSLFAVLTPYILALEG